MRRKIELLLPLLLTLTGCALAPDTPSLAPSQAPFQGRLRGGQQPIAGSRVYLLAANNGGYGGPNIAASSANASVSLIDPASAAGSDSIGAYVTTDVSGSFALGGRYACTPGQQVYLYALGGNPGAGTNTAAGLLAVLGPCPSSGNFAASVPYIDINEVTTIAAAYALAGFATDAAHVSTLNATLSNAGLASAFMHAASIASIASGAPSAGTSNSIDTVALQTVNTLANVLASCVNSLGNSPACQILFSNVDSSTHAGMPTDTATAALYLAQNPYLTSSKISSLYSLSTPSSPFSPTLASRPANFSITQSLAPSTYAGLGDSITCGYVQGWSFTNCDPEDAYPSLLATVYNAPLINAAYPGDFACDLWPVQIAGHNLSPSLTGGTNLSTLMIGTNDADLKGSGSYETTFKLCDTAAVAWQAIPLEAKSLAASAAAGNGWSQGSSPQLGAYLSSSTPGSSATFTISTYGGPAMLWYVIQDSSPGELSYSVDGGTPNLVSVQANPAMSTLNGTTTSVALAVTGALSGSPTAPASHTVTVLNLAGTTQVIGVGTPPMTNFFGHPVLGIADIPNDGPGGPLNTAAAAAYTADAQAIAVQMQGYGLDIRYGSTHNYLLGQANEFQSDELHPNALGASHLSQGFQQILQPM